MACGAGLYCSVCIFPKHSNEIVVEDANFSPISRLTEMSVGVICACMPSLARFVGHQFPNFSILDTLVSLKLISYIKTRTRTRTDSRVIPSGGSKSVRHPFRRVIPIDLTDESLTQCMEAGDLELDHGATASAKTRIISGSNEVQMNDISGIHMQREWAVQAGNSG